MKEPENVYQTISTVLANLDRRGMASTNIFADALSMLRNIGYRDAAVYIVDELPDAIRVVARSGDQNLFPDLVPSLDGEIPDATLARELRDVDGMRIFPLFSHGQRLGALVIRTGDAGVGDKALTAIVRIFSVLAYIERVRTNCQRERLERETFFAQALTNRLMMREPPENKYYRLGFERWRALESGGDFFDFIPIKDGRVYGFIGRCSGSGMKAALEMVEIMHHIDRSFVGLKDLRDVVAQVNRHLVRIKNRSGLASLCLFELDPSNEKLRLVRAGNFGLAICHSGHLHNMSQQGNVYLGMIDNLEMEEEEFEFKPGSAIVCATESVFRIRNRLNQRLPARDLDQTILDARRGPSTRSLVNVAFDRIRNFGDYTFAEDSITAISAEFLER